MHGDANKALPSVATIVFVDIATERLRVVQRVRPDGWNDIGHDEPIGVALSSLGVTLDHADIFARD